MHKRVACCLLINFSLERILTEQPSLRTQPVALAEGAHPAALLVAVNEPAAQSMVQPGLTIAQAHTRCEYLVVLPRDDHAEQKLTRKVVRTLQRVGPFVEGTRRGICFLEAAGLTRLYGSESQLAERIIATVSPLGYPVAVGVGGNKFVAQTAAAMCPSGSYHIVAPGHEKQFVTNLPVQAMDITPDTRQRLHLLGLRKVHQVAAIGGNELVRRFELDGRTLSTRCLGGDYQLFAPERPDEKIRERLVLEFPIATVAALMAHLETPLSTLLTRHRQVSNLGCQELRMRLTLDDYTLHEVTVAVEPPTLQTKPLLRQMAQTLAQQRLTSAVREIELAIARTGTLVAEQLTLDHHRRSTTPANAKRRQVTSLPFLPEQYPAQAAELDHTSAVWEHPFARRSISGLRLLPAPRPVTVGMQDEQPTTITLARRCQRISHIQGPWDLSGGWWHHEYARRYFELETANGRRCLVYHDSLIDRWYLQGMFD